MILGYNIMVCPICQEGELSQISNTIICSKCNRVDSAAILARILRLPVPVAAGILSRGNYGSIVTNGNSVASRFGDLVTNRYDFERKEPQHSFPAIYEEIPAEGPVIIIDDIRYMETAPPNVISFFPQWIAYWNGFIAGREIVLLYTSNETGIKTLASNLKTVGCQVLVGKFEGDWGGALLGAVPYGVRQTEEISSTTSLRDVINSFHWTQDARGHVYKRSLNVPTYEVVEAVIKWFRDNGGHFMWDVENKCGYLLFNNEVYTLDPGDKEFRGMLFKLGGITKMNGDGSSIIDGMCLMTMDADKIAPTPWITCTPGEKMIIIRQGVSSIVIRPNSVTVEPTEGISYDMIQGSRKWFTPVKLEEGDGLPLLFNLVAKHFAVPDTAKEILICWLMSAFLAGYSSIRPGVRITGPASTGKSTLLQLLYWLFYGRNEQELVAMPTAAGLWRAGAVEPFIPLDNENVEELDESFRSFLDVCATGGKRIMGVSGSPTETRIQKAHTLVAISGLDNFLHHDVRTRYIEIATAFEYKLGYHALEDREAMMASRNLMLSSVFRLLANDILPTIGDYIGRDISNKYRIILGSKERIVDYFLLMMAIGKALQAKGLIAEGDIGLRWSEYIKENATETDLSNADTIEWWKLFKLALVTKKEEFLQLTSNGFVAICPWDFTTNNNLRFGMTGTAEQIMTAFSWTARVLNRKCPWTTSKAMLRAHKIDGNAWKAIGWEFNCEDLDKIIVKWGDGI